MTKLTEHFNLRKGGGGFLRAESWSSPTCLPASGGVVAGVWSNYWTPCIFHRITGKSEVMREGLYVVKLFK